MTTLLPKNKKGTYGYMNAQRKIVILQTFLFYAVSLAIFAIGYLHTGSEKNLLTVVAVLGLLPSSKSAVRMIMFLKAPRFSEKIAHEIALHADKVDCVYELVLTAYEGTFPVTCIAVKDHSICAFSEFSQCKTDAFEEHVKKMLKQGGYQEMTVKMISDFNKFVSRLQQMAVLPANGKEQEILQLMCDISL